MKIVGGITLRQSVVRFRGRMKVANRLALCSVLAVLAGCVMLAAQNVVLTGGLSGRVTDPSGAMKTSKAHGSEFDIFAHSKASPGLLQGG